MFLLLRLSASTRRRVLTEEVDPGSLARPILEGAREKALMVAMCAVAAAVAGFGYLAG